MRTARPSASQFAFIVEVLLGGQPDPYRLRGGSRMEGLELHRRIGKIVVLVRTGQKFVVRREEGSRLVLQRVVGVFVVPVCGVRIGRIYIPVTRHPA